MELANDSIIGNYLLDNPQIARSDSAQPVETADQAREASQKFEALLLQTMLKAMRKTMPGNALFGSDQADMYMDMFDQSLSTSIASGKSLGIADAIYRQIAPRLDTDSKAPGVAVTEFPAQISPANQPVEKLAAAQESFINRIVNHAKDTAAVLGTKAEAVLAIAALETGWGSRVAQRDDGRSTHNLFGIKADRSWTGETSVHGTSEFSDGKWQTEQAHFRAYDSEQRSIQDFGSFIQRNPRYETALKGASDPEKFIREMHKAGYATDPDYADKAISIMQQIAGSDRLLSL